MTNKQNNSATFSPDFIKLGRIVDFKIKQYDSNQKGEIMKLSENFDSSEFKCKCCGELPAHGMDSDLIKLLQDIRDKLGKSISITSGYRCEERNKAVGGAKHSQHVLGTAADITVAGMDAHEVYDFITEHFNDRAKGLGRYKNFTHVDCRNGGLARWVG